MNTTTLTLGTPDGKRLSLQSSGDIAGTLAVLQECLKPDVAVTFTVTPARFEKPSGARNARMSYAVKDTWYRRGLGKLPMPSNLKDPTKTKEKWRTRAIEAGYSE